jgi:FMN phosphatase YigB (HAD superfamily)
MTVNMAKIKYIFRDFRWTVTKLDTKKYGYVSGLSKIYKLPKNEIHSALTEPICKFRRWDITEDKFWKELSKNLNAPIPDWKSKFFLFNTPAQEYAEQYKSVINFIHKLKSFWYKNIILSDDYKPQVKKLKEIWRYKPFDSIVVSCDVGFSKRDDITNGTTQIFDYTLKKYWINSDECIFVDDKEANCIVAEKAWIKSVVFHSPRQAIK